MIATVHFCIPDVKRTPVALRLTFSMGSIVANQISCGCHGIIESNQNVSASNQPVTKMLIRMHKCGWRDIIGGSLQWIAEGENHG